MEAHQTSATDAPTAIETASREVADDVDPVEMAREEASNSEDTVSVRIRAVRDGGVSFEIDSSAIYDDWYKPDHIIAEELGVKENVREALTMLQDEVDLRQVPSGRVGAIHFDRETGQFVKIKLFLRSHSPDGVEQRMATCFN